MKLMSRQRGESLVNMMLALMVMGALTAALLPLMVSNADEATGKQIGDERLSFQRLAGEFLEANRAALVAAMTDGTGASDRCKVGVDTVTGTGGEQKNSTTLHTCWVDAAMLKYMHSMSSEMNTTNRYGETWFVIYKLEYSGATPTSNVSGLVLSGKFSAGVPPVIVADDRTHRQNLAAMVSTGGSGGYVPDTDRSTCVASRAAARYEVCGLGWKVNLADYLEAADLATFANQLPN